MATPLRQLEGPPWDTYVDADEAYVRKQAGSMGSGLLGGWSQATSGGSFGSYADEEDDVRRTVAELAGDPPDIAHAPEQLAADSDVGSKDDARSLRGRGG
jgi:hypothetical protein